MGNVHAYLIFIKDCEKNINEWNNVKKNRSKLFQIVFAFLECNNEDEHVVYQIPTAINKFV